MAARRTHQGNPKATGRSADAAWKKLTWGHLESWAGGRSVTRGRSYQRGGRVKDLRIAGDGEVLLAPVVGSDHYAVTVALQSGDRGAPLKSNCTCPVGSRCKHAVAVVAEYLRALADGREIPTAPYNDQRWAKLAAEGVESDDRDDDDD